ncbi:hypothetical protein [Rheinheimera sp. NSM]|uniref:hypothetical protein n=1 Tax=Rheinheimera sp. NSM TaxID=3457884 RepID=UPI0040358B6A
MKFIWNTLKSGALCFFFTPALMAITVALVKLEKVNSTTELPPWLESAINWRYSFEGFFLVFFVSLIVCLLLSGVLKTQKIPRNEQVKLAKYFNFYGVFIAKLLLFWGGMLFAWSFGSKFVDFIPPVAGQEIAVLYCVVMAILWRYGALKFKHWLLER